MEYKIRLRNSYSNKSNIVIITKKKNLQLCFCIKIPISTLALLKFYSNCF